MSGSSLKQKLINGGFWSLLGHGSHLVLALIGYIFLARLLTPEDFGVMGIIMFFISLANVLVDSGFGGALVRKKDVATVDYSTVFFFNLSISIFFFLLIVLSSSLIGDFYQRSDLNTYLIVAALILLINAFQIVHSTKLIIDLKFKERTVFLLISTFCSNIIGISLGFLGCGVWALIAMQLSRALINTALLWFLGEKIVKLQFSKQSFKDLFSFGFFTTSSSLLNQAFNNIYNLILGRFFKVSDVGYYYQANRLQQIPIEVFNVLSNNVIYSNMSKYQENREQFSLLFFKIVKTILAVLGLVVLLLYLYIDLLIPLLLGDQWIPSIVYFKILIFSAFFLIQENFNRVIFKIFNQTHKIFYLELIKKALQLVSIGLGIYYQNIIMLLIGYVITNAFGYVLNERVSNKVINGQNKRSELITTFKVLLAIILSCALHYLLTEVVKVSTVINILSSVLYITTYIITLLLLGVLSISDFKKIKLLKI